MTREVEDVKQQNRELENKTAQNWFLIGAGVVVGGIIPPSDYQALYDAGVVGIFGPGTPVTESANQVLKALEQRG